LSGKGSNRCKDWPDYPIRVDSATGGLIGNTVIICGGGREVADCYSLTSKKATLATHMSVVRYFAASIVLNDNTLWVTGGLNVGGVLASTEYVTINRTLSGPDLPTALYRHAMVAINSSCSMVIGGYNEYQPLQNKYSASTFYYDHIKGKWSNGPSLINERSGLVAGIVTDEVTNENFVLVTSNNKSSTEILQDGKWVQGKIIDTL
jgi:hypothetical protein